MLKLSHILFHLPVLICFLLYTCDSNDDQTFIVPENGYVWPSNDRDYWPTEGWLTAPMEAHQIDPAKMNVANQFAENDPLARALIVIKDGYIVYENYYGDGGVTQSTNLWSVTKSYSSAIVGLFMDQQNIVSTDQLMTDLLPDYPEFDAIKLQHVLTMTTGLAWNEEGPPWVDWILSDDWVASALARGQIYAPGRRFKYSSGNSHFLTSLIYYRTGEFPGQMAKEHLFDPMGVPFEVLDQSIPNNNWQDYIDPIDQSWKKDTKGIECGGFGLFLTARDMAKFGFLYLNKGRWEDEQLISETWVETSTRDHETNIYGRYSYGYQWWLTLINGHPSFLASGFGGQIIGVVPSLDLVVVLKYEAENAVHPESGTAHDDMHLFELVARAVIE